MDYGHSQFPFPRVVYDRVQKRKNYFEIPAFLQIERGKSRAGKFKTSNENKNVFVFIWFWISRSWSSSFVIQKGGNFKIIFLVPYPIIYNPGLFKPVLHKNLKKIWSLLSKISLNAVCRVYWVFLSIATIGTLCCYLVRTF